MKISMSWLRELANPNVIDNLLINKLTMSGLEVESVVLAAPFFSNVLVARVVKCEKHPYADKLSLCEVDVGQDKLLKIICGANNVRAGINVAVALVGAKLPSGIKIKKIKLRSVESNGMICSEAELGISSIADNIMELDKNMVVGSDIRKQLNLDDNVMEIGITPNRGDCFSVLGVAREVCANYDLVLNLPKYKAPIDIEDKIDVSISNKDACPKYLTRIIKGVNNSLITPQWISQRLLRSGQQTISPIVDIINFVTLELGQPMHAFDLTKINGSINIRMANADEELTLLNKQTVKLSSSTLVIADNISAIAIAGVMGGLHSGVEAHSNDVLLESAFFDSILISGEARKYNLNTEASVRFERGVDFNITAVAIERATELILKICGGSASVIGASVYKSFLPKLTPITIDKATIKRILGFELDSNWIEDKFNGLNFKIIDKGKDYWTIMPPSFRFDIRIAEDLVEELARLYGYDKLPTQKIIIDKSIKVVADKTSYKHYISQSLVNRGYQEVINYSFISEKYHKLISPKANKIVISNPISIDMSIMRSSLWAGLLQNVVSNARRGYTDIRFFEFGLCFSGVKMSEQLHKISGVISGNRFGKQWATDDKNVDFFDIKADVESLLLLTDKTYIFAKIKHPALQIGQAAKIMESGKQIGLLGALSPKVQKSLSLAKCYLFELEFTSLSKAGISKYKEFSAYQKSSRDIALIVDENVEVGELIARIKSMQQEHLVGVNLFDVYTGRNIAKGKKSIAFSLDYQAANATLTFDEVNKKVSQVLEFIKIKYIVEQRII